MQSQYYHKVHLLVVRQAVKTRLEIFLDIH